MDDQTQAQADELKRLAAETRFAKEKALSRAENLMLEKAATGELANCSTLDDKGYDPKKADDWTPERQIRAELVAWLCTNEPARQRVHSRGIQVYGAEITGSLDLSFVNISFQLML